MAITKIHPVHRTLGKTVKYITNPDKTDGQLLVTTFGCSVGTVVEEFAMTERLGNDRGNTLAQHMIQSFKPGEVTPEEAHRIGIELVNALTAGRHEYIITPHIDKGHIHNHVIFNQTDFVDHRKFRSNKQTIRTMRDQNDRICAEHGLDVIREPKGTFFSHYEWQKRREGNSYKHKLQVAIDKSIACSATYDDFLKCMSSMGYEIKLGKYISFRAKDQERFTRAKVLGTDYTEERILERIKNREPVIIGAFRPLSFASDGIGLIMLVENYIKCQESPAYRHKVQVGNVKKLAATYNHLKDHGIDSVETLASKEQELRDTISARRSEIRAIESDILKLGEQAKYAERIHTLQPIWNAYCKSGKNPRFRETHRAELMLYEAVKKAIDAFKADDPTADSDTLMEKKDELAAQLEAIKLAQKELVTVRKNVKIVLNSGEGKEQKKTRERE